LANYRISIEVELSAELAHHREINDYAIYLDQNFKLENFQANKILSHSLSIEFSESDKTFIKNYEQMTQIKQHRHSTSIHRKIIQ